MEKKRILLVEDDENLIHLISRRLANDFSNLEISVANDGISASQEAEFNKYDLIITDLNLPRKDGNSVIKRIRFSKYNQDTPLVVITGHPNEGLVKENAPIFLLEKPFKQKDLTEVIRSLLKIDKRSLKHHHSAFQSIITGLEQILGRVNVNIHKMEQPQIREAGDELPGDLQLFFNFEFDKSHMFFDVSATMATVQNLYGLFTSGKQLESEIDIRFAGDELVKMLSFEITNYFLMQGLKAPIFYKKSSQIDSDSPESVKAQASKGFSIKLQTSVGEVYIQSLLINETKGRLSA
jgi:CheY-like chemotaxis protein